MERAFKGVWIPKEIWLSKNLTLQEKIFLVEIDSLDNCNGCFASNDHFAIFFNLSKNRCSEILKSLKKKGYVDIEYIYKENSKEILKRIITIKNKKKYDELTPSENRLTPSENCEDNNTINNTINIYSANDVQDIWELYPNKKGKAQAMKKIPKLLESLGKEVLAECVKKYSAEVKGKDKQFILNGSTFFNGRYEDYLDDAIEVGSKENNTCSNNMHENKYTFNLSEDM